jgi:hypothetical protein
MHCAAMRRGGIVTAAAAVLAAAVGAGARLPRAASPATSSTAPPGAKLDHLIFIVHEDRSCDRSFGTYPGADGIATKPDGSFTVCLPDPRQGERSSISFLDGRRLDPATDGRPDSRPTVREPRRTIF